MRYLIFDIETVPLTDLTEPLEREAARRTERELEKGGLTTEEAESLVRSVSPFLGQVLAIGMRLYNDESGEMKDKVISEPDETATLQTFLETINSPASQDLRYVHFNGLNFDVPGMRVADPADVAREGLEQLPHGPIRIAGGNDDDVARRNGPDRAKIVLGTHKFMEKLMGSH